MVFATLLMLSHFYFVFRGCQTNLIEIVNGWGHDVNVLVRATDKNGEILLDRELSSVNPQVLGVDLRAYGDTVYYVYVRNTKTDEILTGAFGYVFPHDGDKNLFLIKNDGIHHTSWSMFGNGVVGVIRHAHHFITNEISCRI